MKTSAVAKTKEPFNPFYFVLLLSGIAFAVTACAYGVMAFKNLDTGPLVDVTSGKGLLAFLERYGSLLLSIELAVLGIATGGVIGWDQWSSARTSASRKAAQALPGKPSGKSDGTSMPGDTGDPR